MIVRSICRQARIGYRLGAMDLGKAGQAPSKHLKAAESVRQTHGPALRICHRYKW
jgi:hypothetical protein